MSGAADARTHAAVVADPATAAPSPSGPGFAIGSSGMERTVASYLGAFVPLSEWDKLARWPPDVFALANLVLDHTEAYRFVVSPPPGRHWPPFPDWSEHTRVEARGWAEAANSQGRELPPLVRRCWNAVTSLRDLPLQAVRSGEAWDLITSLLSLHAVADEACSRVVSADRRTGSSFEGQAWRLLQAHGSLSRLSPARVRIVPKTQLSRRGITIRSVSKHLSLCYESVDVRWRSIEPGPAADRGDYNIALVPWPRSVGAKDFRPAVPPRLDNMDMERFGFFEFSPEARLDCGYVASLLDVAVAEAGSVDAVVFPEAAVEPEDIAELEATLAEHGATFLIAGVREPPTASSLGRNYLHFGVRSRAGWNRYEQDKHHRWRLDERQVRQYRLSKSLDPNRVWWEAIDVHERALHIIEVRGGITTAPLVCEDLARLDEVADLVRRIGPSLVVAVLLDGPQLATRWPCRYSSVLTDDPGSAVLTLTSLGMASRACGVPKSRTRVVAHWSNPADGLHEIELAPGAAGILLSASVENSTLWTADGRRHRNVPHLKLSGIHQLPSRPGRRVGPKVVP